jgi:hypothetical protein
MQLSHRLPRKDAIICPAETLGILLQAVCYLNIKILAAYCLEADHRDRNDICTVIEMSCEHT